MSGQALSFDAFIRRDCRPDVAAVLLAACEAARDIAHLIRKGALAGDLAQATTNANADGDAQKALDVIADQRFMAAMSQAGVAALVSEELPSVQPLNADGSLLVALDPLDGSSNIDTNVSVGSILSVLPRPTPDQPVGEQDFMQSGNRQLAAAVFIYGPQTALVFSIGQGTHIATLDDDSGQFIVTRSAITIPEGAAEFAINASNYRHWHGPVQAYIDDCIQGSEGPRARNFNMRWIASMVADAFRIFVRGGIYLYPADQRRGYERGRLRHLYEANPIALLTEQAGGGATDGVNRLLDLIPTGLHARIPLVFGSADKVDRVRRYHLNDAKPLADTAPLFGKRGLLRS